MTQKVSLGFNVVLLVAVIYLFYAHFSGQSTVVEESPVEDVVADSVQTDLPDVGPNAKIAYVNIDSLNANYEFLTDMQNDLIAEQTKMEGRVAARAKEVQEKLLALQQRQYTSQQEVQAAEMEAQNMQIELENYRARLANELMDKEVEHQKKLYENVRMFIERYNEEHDFDYVLNYSKIGGAILFTNESLDITNDVIAGLNEEYKKQQETPEAPAE